MRCWTHLKECRTCQIGCWFCRRRCWVCRRWCCGEVNLSDFCRYYQQPTNNTPELALRIGSRLQELQPLLCCKIPLTRWGAMRTHWGASPESQSSYPFEKFCVTVNYWFFTKSACVCIKTTCVCNKYATGLSAGQVLLVTLHRDTPSVPRSRSPLCLDRNIGYLLNFVQKFA